MRVTVLLENTSSRPDIGAEHGLSLYLETASGMRVLFDMGGSALFAKNAEVLGIALDRTDAAVLSHGHYDHGGGLSAFLQCCHDAPVYISPHAFLPHFSGDGAKYIGLDPSLAPNGHMSSRFRAVEDQAVIGEGVTVCSCRDCELREPLDTAGLGMVADGCYLPEDFRHEQYLLIEEDGRRILVSGCSHRGILNIMEWFSPDVLIGGFHLMKRDPACEEDRALLDRIAERLLSYSTVFYTGHCTGGAAYCYLKERMMGRLHDLSGGREWII
ncbi:MAG: MBL fold metallo-hydrolase [Ruminococcaceae bacterium]|nr:MBL fold metallo-hydrolase [Oscillospiraceae bacterium]